jgi:hypothetical protein
MAVLLSASGQLTLSPAAASNFWGATHSAPACSENASEAQRNTGNMADNSSHTFNFQGTTPTWVENMINWSRTNNLDPTNIDTSLDATLDVHTDVVVRNGDYENGWCGNFWGPAQNPGIAGTVAVVTCDYLLSGSGGKCDRFTMFLLRWYLMGQTTSDRRKVACHENGHTVGLEHAAHPSCMSAAGPVPQNGSFTTHDQNHLNDPINYP